MDTLQALSLAMGTAWTSGINLYATVAALGIAGRTEMIQLPPDLASPHPSGGHRGGLRYVLDRIFRR